MPTCIPPPPKCDPDLNSIIHWLSPLPTCGLNLLQTGRDDDTLESLQLEVLGDLPQAADVAAPSLGLDGVLEELAVLEAEEICQEELHGAVDLLADHVSAVPSSRKRQTITQEAIT